MRQGDKDLELKLRIQAILWRLGYYTRIGVKLAMPVDVAVIREKSLGSRRPGPLAELTDLDVLGIRYDTDYTVSYAVADCSTDKSRGPISRTFWLRGIMHYFRADRGYEVLTKELSSHEKSVAEELGITLLDEKGLQALEERYSSNTVPLNIRLTDAEAYERMEAGIRSIDRRLANLLTFRDYTFWQNKPNRNLLAGIALFKRTNGNLDPAQKFQRILILDILSLFSIAFLQVCGIMFRTSTDNVYPVLRAHLFGGPAAVKDREVLLSNIKALVDELERHVLLPPDDLTRNFAVEPEYLPTMADLAQRFVDKPAEAKDVPRYLEAILLEQVLTDGRSLSEVFGSSYSEITLKFVYDIARFYQQATGLNAGMLQDLDKIK